MMKPKKPRVHPDSFATLDDNEENLLVTVELLGVKKEDIDLRMRNDVIYVKAEEVNSNKNRNQLRMLLTEDCISWLQNVIDCR